MKYIGEFITILIYIVYIIHIVITYIWYKLSNLIDILLILCIEPPKKLSKKEQKAKEDAEFEAMMAELATNNKTT